MNCSAYAVRENAGWRKTIMKKYLYDKTGTSILEVAEIEPVCSVDFCEDCGDCVVCNRGICANNGDDGHRLIDYEK